MFWGLIKSSLTLPFWHETKQSLTHQTHCPNRYSDLPPTWASPPEDAPTCRPFQISANNSVSLCCWYLTVPFSCLHSGREIPNTLHIRAVVGVADWHAFGFMSFSHQSHLRGGGQGWLLFGNLLLSQKVSFFIDEGLPSPSIWHLCKLKYKSSKTENKSLLCYNSLGSCLNIHPQWLHFYLKI